MAWRAPTDRAILAGERAGPIEPHEHLLPCVIQRRLQAQAFAAARMRELQAPRMQQHAVHAQMHAPQAVVIAAAMAGVADDVVRNVMEMLADLPEAAGF